MLFDAYVPTRTHSALEVRVRSGSTGPVVLELGEREATLTEPRVSHRGRHFFRHTFEDLPSRAALGLRALDLATGAETALGAATLPAPVGQHKLSVGLLADLHLSLERSSIDRYRRGEKRLYGLGLELAERYLQRLEALGADVIVLPGDLVDPCTERSVAALREILGTVKIPCYPIIGNHEPWSPGGIATFQRGLGLPDSGYYAVTHRGVRLLLLSTPEPDALGPDSAQIRWLESELRAAPAPLDIVLFSHFSLLLHPCVAGPRNDGYQLLSNHRALLALIARYPNVRVFSAGHKNVPSRMLRGSTLHLLSPQLIQAPCACDMLRFYEGGVSRTVYEIDEQHYVEVARGAYEHVWPMRYGDEDGRNFWHEYAVESAAGRSPLRGGRFGRVG
ncbi:MAG: metallophosphoesterase [Polyangiaceae bacterium]|nr:metallophosphoesterase [Polyangiaceae bacterium]